MTTQNAALAGGPVVLLVDDDATHRKALAFDYKRRGFEVLQAGSGQEAWALFQAKKINLVVTDIRMANGHGMELLNRIRERDPAIPPVILMTGYTELDLDAAEDWGAHAVFYKPFDRRSLLAVSQEAVKGSK